MVNVDTFGDSLIIRPLSSDEDAARFITHNHAITGEGPICDRLIFHFPGASLADFFIAEDTLHQEIASSTCLLPWKICFDGIELRAAMLEMVVTKPSYRRLGLVRRQIVHFKELAARRSFDFSIIQGIPYYYRQFGYSYALDHTPLESIACQHIPDEPVDTYEIRQATPADCEALANLYTSNMFGTEIYVERSLDYWDYLLCHVAYPLQIVQHRKSGNPLAYFHEIESAETATIDVLESALANPQDSGAILNLLKQRHPLAANFRIGGSPSHPLVRLARALGSSRCEGDQWLLHLHDPHALLIKLAPLFEKRIKNSPFNGLTGKFTLNFYRQAYCLDWKAGRLEEITPIGFVDASMGTQGSDLQIPPEAFVRLLFGYRSLEELQDAWPDTRVRDESRPIWQALFPHLNAWINMTY